MKRLYKELSVKVKLTLLYTTFMILTSIASLTILLSISSSQIVTSVQNRLEQQVIKSFQHIEWDDGELEIDSDIMDIENGIYISVYQENGQLLYGKIPYDFNFSVQSKEGVMQTLEQNGVKWYVFDSSAQIEYYGKILIRGIVSVTKAEESLNVLIHTSFILLPLLLLVTIFVGYRFTSHVLKPVDDMTKSVQDICEKKDLSKRIVLDAGNDEIHRLGKLLNQMLEQLEQAFEREKQFTSDVSHELRTPISVILSHCELLLERDTLQGEERKEVEVIFRKTNNMAQLVSQILMLSRADRNKIPVQFEEIPLSELVEMVVEEQEQFSEKKGITITMDIQPDIFVQADETLMIRLFSNLIENAISYGKENGTIIVRLYEDETQWTGQIEDNGIGIPKEHLEKIWERFYRVDPARSEGQNSSSGLGLSMVQWIVKVHNGTIFVSSEEGIGTCFTFHIPKRDQKKETF